MKRAIALLFAAVLLLGLTACDGGKPSTSSHESSIEQGETTTTSVSAATTTETQQSASTSEAAETTWVETTSTEKKTTTTREESTTSAEETTTRSSKKTTTRRHVSLRTEQITTTTEEATMTTTTVTTTTSPAYLTLTKTNLYGSSDNKQNWVYRLGDEGVMVNTNGLTVRETNIDVGLGGDTLEIVQISDGHVGYDPISRVRWKNCLEYAGNFDYMVLTGDLIEGLTNALADHLKLSLKPYENVMMVLGNHEWNKASDECPEDMEGRYDKLQEYWRNDIYYSSVVLKNKVMLIQMDNSQSKFWDHQILKFQKDLNEARSKGYAVLLFVHVPLGTNNPKDKSVDAVYSSDIPAYSQNVNFSSLKPGPSSSDTNTKTVYEMITNSADVIKGVFSGHLHNEISIPRYAQKHPMEKKPISRSTYVTVPILTADMCSKSI